MSTDFRILLVDDFEVNQKIARLHLHKGGYEVDLAANGQQAVEAFMQNRYDLILMDIDMPVMDGFEAALSIRSIEKKRMDAEAGDHSPAGSIPIIAMSGNAAAGDDGHPALPGMDDYIGKPFQRAELLELVEKWIAGPQCHKTAEACRPPVEPPAAPEPPLDMVQALTEFMGAKDVLTDVLESFVADGKACIQTAREALLTEEYSRVQSLAHKLGGGAANLTAKKLADAAYVLENAVQEGKINEVRPLLQKLEQEFRQLETYIRQNAVLASKEE